MILIDSNVVLDALDIEAEWRPWSLEALTQTTDQFPFVNPIVVAEIGTRFRSLEELDAALRSLSLPVMDLSLRCSWLAGRAHLAWIRNGGRRGAMLADILIGAHALGVGASVLTRDPRRFRTYFPEVELITPELTDDN